jgi:SnoaL-like domain
VRRYRARQNITCDEADDRAFLLSEVGEEFVRKSLLCAAFSIYVSTPVLAQKAEIQKTNAQFIELFNKGDFVGVSKLYTADAVALPPDVGMVRGRNAIEALWKDLGTKSRS